MSESITKNPLSREHHVVTIVLPEIENHNKIESEQKTIKIIFICVIYGCLPILLLLCFILFGEKISFTPPKNDFIHIKFWILIHSILGFLDMFSVILLIVYLKTIWEKMTRTIWFIVYIIRGISFIIGSIAFYAQYNQHLFEPYFVKIIIWITLVGGIFYFITQGIHKINQFYLCSNNVLDVY